MFWLSRRTLRTRPGSFVASFITLFFGGSVVLACAGLLETGIHTAVPPQRLAAAAVVVTGNQDNPGEAQLLPERVRLEGSIVDKLATLPGVVDAVADVSFPATVVGENLISVTGHGWSSARLAPYRLTAGTEPSTEREVSIDDSVAGQAGVKPGDTVALVVRGQTERFTVTGVTHADGVESASMFFAENTAARLLGAGGRVDSVGLLTDGADPAQILDRAEAAIAGTPAVALAGDDRGLAEFPDALDSGSRLISMSAVFGGVAILVAVFVVGSTLSLLVRQREREIALLRAVGATPRQLRRMILGEAMVIAVLAAALAVVPGRLLGGWLLDQLAGAGVVPEQVVFRQGWIPVVVAAAVTLLAAVGATMIASGAATRTRPTEALAESALPRRWLTASRLIFAIVALAGAMALAIVTASVMTGSVAASTAGPSAILWAGGLALLAPGLTRVLLAIVGGPVRAFTGTAGHLAMLTAKARHIRLAAAATPVMLATGLATALIYIQVSQSAVSERIFSESLRADAVVTSATGGLDSALVDEVGAQPGVAAASALVTSTGYVVEIDQEDPDDEPNTTSVALQGVTSDAAAQVSAATLTAGSFADLHGNSIILPDTVAEDLGRVVGDQLTLRLGDGVETTVRVVGLVSATPGFESGFVPASLVLEHTTTKLLPQVLVRADQGADVAGALSGLASRTPGAVVADRTAVLAAREQENQTGTWVNFLMVAVIVGYALISLVNTLVVATAERRREFALQRLVGATRAQILRMMSVEASLVATCGVVLGTVVAIAALGPFGIALDGSPAPSGPPWIYLAVIFGGTVLTFAATLFPAIAALRHPAKDSAAAL